MAGVAGSLDAPGMVGDAPVEGTVEASGIAGVLVEGTAGASGIAEPAGGVVVVEPGVPGGTVIVVSRNTPPPLTLPAVVVLVPDICCKQSLRSATGRLLHRFTWF
ncbi:hypothetical protein [Allopusillimonas ginsengisoli]|uniref:hypothetical protein n=1 Tax=Allopusillimonas ginsengisoli TaxID=453575 RepID=UPI0010218B47|nr:hypothetical protein [Allopusillimonas ginsengisoli]TEA74250.1 hypothetical protein ERE07_18395 [Allopusillimonas ginsengisoli]